MSSISLQLKPTALSSHIVAREPCFARKLGPDKNRAARPAEAVPLYLYCPDQASGAESRPRFARRFAVRES